MPRSANLYGKRPSPAPALPFPGGGDEEAAAMGDQLDKSGNGRDATSDGGAPSLNATSGPGGGPVIEFRRAGGDDYLAIGGSAFFAKEHYYVFRSSDAANKFDYYGGVLGHGSGRGSNYLWENNQPYFHSNKYPAGVQQNGGSPLSGTFGLSSVNQFMILRIVVNDETVGPHSNYKIGRNDNHSASVDIAEILAYSSVLAASDRLQIEGYLAHPGS